MKLVADRRQRRPPPSNGAVGFFGYPVRTSSHKWAAGTTFEREIDFPTPANSAYQAKPKAKKTHGVAKTRASAGRWTPAGARHAG